MSFVNEYIPKEDLAKYDFAELNKRPRKGGDQSDHWTVDRDADIWLRKFYTESDHTAQDGGYTGISAWDFYWKGTLMLIEIKSIELTRDENKNSARNTSKLISIDIPQELEEQRKQILTDVELAFNAHKGSGILSIYDHYSFMLDYREIA